MLSESESKVNISVTIKPPQKANVDVVFSSAELEGFSITIPTDDTGHGFEDKDLERRSTIWEVNAYWYDDSGLRAKDDCGSIKKIVSGFLEGLAKAWKLLWGTIVISGFLAAGAGLTYKAIWGTERTKFLIGLILLIIAGIFYSVYFPITI
jgi:hypothetical protein